jgi:hypothetical protein
MSFKFISVQSIKSDSQQALASHWDRLAATRRFPAFVEFYPEPSAYHSGQLVVWNIEGAGRLQKFRALYQGENVAEVFQLSLGRQDDGSGRSDVSQAGYIGRRQGMCFERLPHIHDRFNN